MLLLNYSSMNTNTDFIVTNRLYKKKLRTQSKQSPIILSNDLSLTPHKKETVQKTSKRVWDFLRWQKQRGEKRQVHGKKMNVSNN